MTITEVSKEFDISKDTLRYYENIGLIPPVTRTRSGIRNYTENDIKWVRFSKYMRDSGISVEALAEYVRLLQEGDETVTSRKEILRSEQRKLRLRLEETKAALERLSNRIEHYDDLYYPLERKLG